MPIESPGPGKPVKFHKTSRRHRLRRRHPRTGRIFFNRPFAGSVEDAKEIIRLAEMHKASIYSASALYRTEAGNKAKEALPGLGQILLKR